MYGHRRTISRAKSRTYSPYATPDGGGPSWSSRCARSATSSSRARRALARPRSPRVGGVHPGARANPHHRGHGGAHGLPAQSRAPALRQGWARGRKIGPRELWNRHCACVPTASCSRSSGTARPSTICATSTRPPGLDHDRSRRLGAPRLRAALSSREGVGGRTRARPRGHPQPSSSRSTSSSR